MPTNTSPSMWNWRRLALLLVALSLVRGLIYSAVIPPWQAPDEPQHMEYVKLVYEKQRPINWREDNSPAVESDIIASMAEYDFPLHSRYVDWGPDTRTLNEILGGGASQLHQPPLAYFMYAAPLWLLPASDVDTQLLIARLISVLLSSLVVLTALGTSYELFPDNPFLILGIPAFILLLPSHTYMISSVNNDHLAELIVSLQILLIVRGFHRGFSTSNLLLIALLIPVGLLAKRTAIYILPICAMAVPIYLGYRQRYRVLKWGALALIGLVVLAVPLAAPTGRWLQRLLTQRAPGLYYDYLGFWPPFSPEQDYVGPAALQRYWSYVTILLESFWARFGWMNIRLAPAGYVALALLTLLALVGLARRFLVRDRRAQMDWQAPVLVLFLFGVVSALAIVFVRQIRLWDHTSYSLPQARYLFPLIIPLATLAVVGWEGFFPHRLRHLGLLIFLGGLVLLDAVCLLGYIIPFFYY